MIPLTSKYTKDNVEKFVRCTVQTIQNGVYTNCGWMGNDRHTREYTSRRDILNTTGVSAQAAALLVPWSLGVCRAARSNSVIQTKIVNTQTDHRVSRLS